MYYYALQMLFGDRAKYTGLLFGITFTSFLVTFAASYFSGLLTRSYALISENGAADVWVMDPGVHSVEQTINLPDWSVNRVRNVKGVQSAVPLMLAATDIRFPDGRFQPVQVIGVDDATLAGLPLMDSRTPPPEMRAQNAIVVDPGGTVGKLDLASKDAGPARPVQAGDYLTVEGFTVRVAGRSESFPRYPPRPLMFTTRSTALHVLPLERNSITFVLAKAAPGVDANALADRITTETGLRARSAQDFTSDTVRWMLTTSEDVGDAVTMFTVAMLVGFGVTGVMMYMFTTENLKYYAVFNTMGGTLRTLLAMIAVQAGACGLLGAGIGMGLSAAAGLAFTSYGFPFRMLWFTPVIGAAAVVLVGLVAATLSMWPVLKMEPAALLAAK